MIQIQDIKTFGNIEFLAKQVVEGFITGLHKSPYHGFSVEFAEHRQYNTGESIRHIDWKIYNRTDKLFTKRYEEETNLRCTLVMDISASMYYPTNTKDKLHFTLLSAAAVAYMLQKQRDAVGITAFTHEIVHESAIKSTQIHLREIFEKFNRWLAQSPNQEGTNLPHVLHYVAEKLHKRSLVIIFTDFYQSFDQKEQLYDALKHLKHQKHEVLAFHVTHKATEVDFNFDNRPHEFIDLETNQRVKLNPLQIRDYYTHTVQDFIKELKVKCGQYKIDWIEADCRAGFQQILLPFLIKRSKMN